MESANVIRETRATEINSDKQSCSYVSENPSVSDSVTMYHNRHHSRPIQRLLIQLPSDSVSQNYYLYSTHGHMRLREVQSTGKCHKVCERLDLNSNILISELGLFLNSSLFI